MKLVLFQVGGAGEILPGLLTERGVVSVADIVKKSYTPQLTMNGIIDDFDKLKPAFERAAASGDVRPLSSVRLRAPLPRPGKILCCIANYWEHAQRRGTQAQYVPEKSRCGGRPRRHDHAARIHRALGFHA